MRRLPGVLFPLIAILTAASIWLAMGDKESLIPNVLIGIWLVAMGGIGAVVASRRPDNAVGWLMLAISLIMTLHSFASSYAVHALVEGHQLPGALFAAWLTIWLLVPGFALFIHLLLLFPTGSLPSPRWGWVLRLANALLVVVSVVPAIEPGRIDYVRHLDNPVGIDAASGLLSVIGDAGETLLTSLGFLALASVIIRFRRASGVEREQIKWFVYAVAMIPVLGLIAIPVDAVDGDGASLPTFAVHMTAALLIPISLGVAILRKRLYDIDVVINRTLVYVTLTALLAGAYLGIVVLLQRLLSPLTLDSDLAVAASTLAVAALFRPMRARVQRFIDRRFYRQKYNAGDTLERFAGRVRDEVELDALSHDLIAVVADTMQPTHASLWLRTGPVS